MIRLEKVSKTFAGGIRALDKISFSVRPGEFFSVLGPSGCGKSTLVSLIAGFLKPTSGNIYFDDLPVTAPSRDRIVVFQEHNLFDWKTVSANIEFGLKAKGVPAKERAIIAEKYLKMVRLDEFGNAYPSSLSGGMKQRAALARALAVDPSCILMDEPLGSLDSQMRVKLQTEIMSLWETTGKTILMVTHDIDEAIFLSDRVALLSGPPGAVREIIKIDLPRPRLPSVKNSKTFQELKESLAGMILG